jgi:hypothetical protein
MGYGLFVVDSPQNGAVELEVQLRRFWLRQNDAFDGGGFTATVWLQRRFGYGDGLVMATGKLSWVDLEAQSGCGGFCLWPDLIIRGVSSGVHENSGRTFGGMAGGEERRRF